MGDGYQEVKITRQKNGIESVKTGIAIPGYLMPIIEQEARAKRTTRSSVIAYLILCGLKAHVGEFVPPRDNTIKQNYLKRGGTWR